MSRLARKRITVTPPNLTRLVRTSSIVSRLVTSAFNCVAGNAPAARCSNNSRSSVLIQLRVIEDVSNSRYGLAGSLPLVGKRAHDFSQGKRGKAVTATVQCRAYK